jgi:hypothetical protein
VFPWLIFPGDSGESTEKLECVPEGGTHPVFIIPGPCKYHGVDCRGFVALLYRGYKGILQLYQVLRSGLSIRTYEFFAAEKTGTLQRSFTITSVLSFTPSMDTPLVLAKKSLQNK